MYEMKRFAEPVILEDMFPVSIGARRAAMTPKIDEELPFLTAWYDREGLTAEVLLEINRLSGNRMKTKALSRKAEQMEKKLDHALKYDRQSMKTLKDMRIHARIMHYPWVGENGVGCFRHYENAEYEAGIITEAYFYKQSEIDKELDEVRKLRERVVQSLYEGFYATQESIEAARQAEAETGGILEIPPCCIDMFVGKKRNRDMFLLKFSELTEAREVMDYVKRRGIKSKPETQKSGYLTQGRTRRAAIMSPASPDFKEYRSRYREFALSKEKTFRDVVMELNLEEKIGIRFSEPHEIAIIGQYLKTDGFRYLLAKATKMESGETIIKPSALVGAAEEAPEYLFSAFASFIYPCRPDCPAAMEVSRRIYRSLEGAREGLGKIYRAHLLLNLLKRLL